MRTKAPTGRAGRRTPVFSAALAAMAVACTAACAADFEAEASASKPCGYIPSRARRKPPTKSASKMAYASALPSSWDSRDKGWVTPVRNQSPYGSCWTFAALATVETQLVKNGLASVDDCDLSERGMATQSGFNGVGLNSGGNNDLAAAYLLRWEGALAEEACPYRSSATSVPKNPAVHVQGVVWIPERESATDNEELKRAVMEYGAVAVSFHYAASYENASAGAYYCPNSPDEENGEVNHAVTLVGWDDSYSASNFSEGARPASDGAWLVKNSWGAYDGDNGYLHISYCDKTFMSEPGAVFIPATSEEDYTACYGYDRLGPYVWYSESGLRSWAAVFPSGWNEELAAVGLNLDSVPFAYSISVYTNVTLGAESPIEGGALAATKTGTATRWGFTTVHLDEPVPLPGRTAFSVVVKCTNQTQPTLLLCCPGVEGGAWSTFVPAERRTYVKCGGTWLDTCADGAMTDDASGTAYVGNVCLKAYTRSTAQARDGDTPGGSDDGSGAMLWLADEYDENLFAASSWTFGAFANIVGANGRTLYASWLAGFDPADASDCDLRITSFGLADGKPFFAWRPDLGGDRTYTVYGSAAPAGGEWSVVDTNAPAAFNFFKIGVSR